MVTLRHIGKSADDLRFFILSEGYHAGGITVHSVNPPAFSYGIAIAPALRRRGIAREALRLAMHKLPLKSKIVRKEIEGGESNEG